VGPVVFSTGLLFCCYSFPDLSSVPGYLLQGWCVRGSFSRCVPFSEIFGILL
jgi:hypothetical protein